MGFEPMTPTPKVDTLPVTPCSKKLIHWSESDSNRQTYVCKTYMITNFTITPNQDQIGLEPMTL